MISYFVIDEGSNVDILQNILSDFAELHSQGNSQDRDIATNMILKTKPDLVFINIDGVIKNPFDFVNEFANYLDILPKFIALSSSEKHAYQCIKNGFLDYLKTPISELDVRKLVMRYAKTSIKPIKENVTQSIKTKPKEGASLICIQSYKDYQYIKTSDVLFLKADNNTTDFYLKNETVVTAYKSLKAFEDVLPQQFLRIHKSYIVNEDYVTRINYGKLKCGISNTKHSLPFTKTYISHIDNIKSKLSQNSISLKN